MDRDLHQGVPPGIIRVPSCLFVVLLIGLAVLPYLPGVRHGFVYDDHGAIVENQFLAEPANLGRVLTLDTVRDPRVLDGQRPVLLLTMFLDRAGDAVPRPWRHHATNLLLHASAVLLLFFLVRKAGGDTRHARGLATLCALILALHPAWSEAVQVPSYREDLLGLVFVLAYLAADFIARPAVRWPLQALALALALGAKETAWAAPLLLGWLRVCVPAADRRPRAVALTVLAGLLMVAAYVILGYLGRPLQSAGASWNGLALRWPENLWTAPWIWWRSLALLAVPYPLLADRVVEPVPHLWDPRFLGCLAAALAVAWLAWRERRTQPLLALGLGWLLIAFAPVSNLIPLLNPMADRYLYGLAPGFALVATCWLTGAPARRYLLAALCVAWIIMLQLSLGRWRDDLSLWTATVRTEPRSARAHTWLGLLAKQQGDRTAARVRFQQADATNPQDVSALINLAILEGEEGNLSAAEAQLREAVRRRPDKSEAWANLAVALELQGKRAEALQATEQAASLNLLGP